MTAQCPERLILDGRPRAIYAQPLYRLCKHYRLELKNPHVWCTANYRGYVGTWEIRDGALYLAQVCWDNCSGRNSEVPMPDDLHRRLFRAAGGDGFPLRAHWFNGLVRIPIGRRLVYSHHGWSHWHERERVMRFQGGHIIRDRNVDTRAILEWWLSRNPEARDRLDPDSTGRDAVGAGPLTWFEDDVAAEDEHADWWPPGFTSSSPSQPASGCD